MTSATELERWAFSDLTYRPLLVIERMIATIIVSYELPAWYFLTQFPHHTTVLERTSNDNVLTFENTLLPTEGLQYWSTVVGNVARAQVVCARLQELNVECRLYQFNVKWNRSGLCKLALQKLTVTNVDALEQVATMLMTFDRECEDPDPIITWIRDITNPDALRVIKAYKLPVASKRPRHE